MALIEITGVIPDGSDYGPGVPLNVRQAIKVIRGTNITVRMRLINPKGAPIDVVNVSATHVLTIKKNPNDAPGLLSRSGAAQPQLGANVVDFTLSPVVDLLGLEGNFGYDIFSTINAKRDATVPLSPWKIEPAMGLLGAPVTSVSLVPLTIFGLPLNGLPGQVLEVVALNPFTVAWSTPSGTIKVRAISIANLALTGLPAVQDGVTFVDLDRILLTAQTAGLENGGYIISAAGGWSRVGELQNGAHASTTLFAATEGTARGGQIWSCTTKAPTDLVGTNALAFSQIGAGGSRAPAVGIQGAVDVEDPAGNLGARRRLTFDDIDAAFSGTFSGTFASARALNSPLVNPQFTFTSSSALSAVAGDVTSTDDIDTQNIVPPTSPFGYGGVGLLPARSKNSSTINAIFSWDLKLTKLGGSPVIHRFVTVQFQPNVYFGKSASLGPYNSAFVTGLSAPTLASGSNRDITTTTGAGEFVFYCFPAVFGGVAGDFIDLATNFPFGVSKVAAAVSVDNGFGVLVPIDVWRSDFPNLGTTTMRKQ